MFNWQLKVIIEVIQTTDYLNYLFSNQFYKKNNGTIFETYSIVFIYSLLLWVNISILHSSGAILNNGHGDISDLLCSLRIMPLYTAHFLRDTMILAQQQKWKYYWSSIANDEVLWGETEKKMLSLITVDLDTTSKGRGLD